MVRNTASHDSRVLRCARVLRARGYEVVVVAVTSERERAPRATLQGIEVVRLTPRAPLAGPVRRLRRMLAGAVGGDGRVTATGASEHSMKADRPRAVARLYRLLRTLSYYRRAIATVRGIRPQLLHCNDYNTMWIGVAAKLLVGSAVVYDSHELWPDRNGRTEPRWWLLACEALFLRVADRNLVTSPAHAAAIARRHRVAAPQVVRNVAERPAAAGASGGTKARGDGGARAADGPPATLVYAGAVTGGRGLEQAIAALPRAPGVALRVLGPGSELHRARLAELAAEHGVADRVKLAPPVAPSEVVGELAGATAGLALIQPSCLSYELCLPNKLFEYLAAGLPTLAADLPAIRAFVTANGTGLVVPPADTDAIARAMLEIVEPGRNRQLRAAVAAASAEHRWEREAEILADLYRDASGPRRRQARAST